MSERNYFSNRYLIPGSAFLLIVLVINIVPLYKSLNQQQAITSILGAVIAFLGSPAIGFLASQPWWVWFQRVKFWKMVPTSTLNEKFSLKANNLEKGQKEKILLVYDYILHSGVHNTTGQQGLSTYLFRRYDNYVLLSSTLSVIWIGGIAGIVGRVLGMFLFPNVAFLRYDDELGIWVLILAAVVVLSVVMLYGLAWLEREYKEMHSIVVKEFKEDKTPLRDIFRNYGDIFEDKKI